MKRRMIVFLLTALLAGCAPAKEAAETVRMPQTHPTTEPLPKFRKTVLVDNESCLFQVVDVGAEAMGYTLQIRLENRTQQNLMFSLSSVSVNGYMCDPFWAAAVSAGEKTEEKIIFSQADLEQNEIALVTDIAFTLSVYDADNWTAPRLVEERFSVYPHGVEMAREYPRSAQPGDIMLLDNELCAMTVTGFDPENVWGYTANVYLENRTEADLIFAVTDAAVNGLECDPYWAVTVAAGKKCNTAIHWLEEDFAALGIGPVKALTLLVGVYDSAGGEARLEQTFQLIP